jgi:hypothetical protein
MMDYVPEQRWPVLVHALCSVPTSRAPQDRVTISFRVFLYLHVVISLLNSLLCVACVPAWLFMSRAGRSFLMALLLPTNSWLRHALSISLCCVSRCQNLLLLLLCAAKPNHCRVVHEQGRPQFPPGTPAAYQQLAESCWAQGKHQRPDFDEIVRQLQVQCWGFQRACTPSW